MIRFSLLALIVSLLLISFSSHGQKYELGKVSVKELEEKFYPSDTSAPAAITYKKGKSFFTYNATDGFRLSHEYEFRIKIYKKGGLDWATFKVPYYVGYENLNKDFVVFSDAVTYNLESGTIVKTKLKSEGRFKNKVNEFWNESSIAMPNVKVGSIIEFKYLHKSEDLGEFPNFYFQYAIPVKYAEYRTEIPNFFIYKPISTGFFKLKSSAKEEDGYQNYANEHKQNVGMSYKQINSVYSGENIPALKDEGYIDNVENYRASVQHELEKIRYPQQPEKNFSETWESVAANIYKKKEFGEQLREWQYFGPYLNPFIKNSENQNTKADAVFGYVKRTITWNGKYGYLTRKGVKQAFADKTGNVAEVNLMLIAMLNHVGIEAYPVLLSTKDNGIPAFPNNRIFNYVIAAVIIDGKQLLLDATSKNSVPDILPFRDLNWTGRLIRQDGTSKEINLVPKNMSKESVVVVAKLEANGTLSGKCRVYKTDYMAYGFRETFGKANTVQYVEKLESKLNNVAISNYVVENTDDLLKPISESFDFISNNGVEIIGNKIYINPLLFYAVSKNPFVAETRELPVYFGYPNQEKYNVNIDIPDGYMIESIPKSMALSLGENVGSFTFNIASKENKIQLNAVNELKVTMISGAFFGSLKEFYQKMIDKQNEKIVLKKI